MLILVLILALIRFNPEGAPVNTSSVPQCCCDAVDIYLRDNPTNSHFGTRAQNDIIVSCLATILACTWTTIHPNVPAPGESGWDQLKRKVVTWIYALLAPEAITAWAMRQYFATRWMTDKYNSDFADRISMSVDFEYKNQWTHTPIERPLKKYTLREKIRNYLHEWMYGSPVSEGLEGGEMRPWTITHGFFFQMGGFMRCKKGRPVKSYIHITDLWRDIKDKIVDVPTTTESEIQDRSKGDALSKTIVILQTTWFIAQCIARWSAHLPVTELEVVTLGFAMLNALTYGFWWHKPQSIGVPVFLEAKMAAEEEGQPSEGERTSQVERDREQSVAEGTGAVEGEEQSIAGVESQAVQNAGEERKSCSRTVWEGVKGFWRNLWQLVWRMPYALVLAVLHPLAKLLEFAYTDWDREDLRVPMFHACAVDNESVYVNSSIIASIFGLVHFIPAWFLDFPSCPERLLWRISAGIITGQPIILGAWSRWKKGNIGWSDSLGKSSPVFNVISLAGVPLYIIARLTLLVLAIIALRDLSQGALMSIEWISFVPHL